MISRIQQLPRGQRIVIFILLVAGVIFGLVGITALLAVITLNSGGRSQAVALIDGATAREFAALPGDDAYPAAVTTAVDGSVIYSGSYVTGVVWAIQANGIVSEIPDTFDTIGAVAGLTVAPDGTLYVVDQEDSNPVTLGGRIWRITPDGMISDFAIIPDERGFVLPDDVTLDPQGNVYVSDRGRREVWRFASDGSASQAWWTAPAAEEAYAPTGLAYDPANAAIIITDSNQNTIWRVSLDGQTTETLYEHGNREFPPVFDGVTVRPDGTLYVAALEQNGIATLVDGELQYVAGSFRGSSDVDYAAGSLYVTNFDSFSLVVAAVTPRLPFAIDVIELP